MSDTPSSVPEHVVQNGDELVPLFLGLDLSTQQLKAIVCAEDGSVVHETAVNFDRDLPSYGTKNGAVFGALRGEVTSPVAMWVDALDLLFERMRADNVKFGQILGISGAGQQHGSVYWSHRADHLLASLDSEKSLTSQLCPDAFSIQQSPIWQDSSTTEECKLLNKSVGGEQSLADLTGSRAYERFTASQILKIRNSRPDAYSATAYISLVSSFISSLFVGRIAPIEVSDASGMNLMNVLTHKWDEKLLEVCGGPELRAKLAFEPMHGGHFIDKIAEWWVKRYGFNPECAIAPFTGDNPASTVSLSTLGDAIISLGTSTTLLLDIPPSKIPPKRFTSSHLLAHPTDDEASIAMLCYKNGALAREQVRSTYTEGHWHIFNEKVETTPPGNNGYLGFYFPLIEIIPPNVHGCFFFKDGKPVEIIPEEAHPRAILESQFLSIKSRIAAILPPDSPLLHRLILTGGSSQNHTFRQLAADVFGLPTYVAETKEAAGHGGALLALYAWWKKKNGGVGTFEELKDRLVEKMQLVARPRMEITSIYDGLVESYRIAEDQVVRLCSQ